MRKKFVSLLLICGLSLTACSNSGGEDTTLTETISTALEATTQTEASETAAESETEPENLFPEFTGIDISDEALDKLDNHTINKSSSIVFHIFCYSEDMIYFADVNNGWKLCSYDGEKTSLILDQQAYYLYYYDNCIYFLSGRNVDALNYYVDGILYKFDIESGNVTKLTDEIVHLPRADETGIYYSKEYEGKFYIYRLDEESGEDERLYEGYAYYRIGDYEISRVETGKKGEDEIYDYYLLKGDEKICFVSGTTVVYDFIRNGIFYFEDWDYELRSVDLRTGETSRLSYPYSFTTLGDELYFCKDTPSFGYRLFHLQDGEPEEIYVVGVNIPFDTGYRGNWEDHDTIGYGVYGFSFHGTNCVYSDNKSLYVLIHSPDGMECYLAKVGTLDDGSGDYIIDPIH